MKIVLGLLFMSISMFCIGWYISKEWKKGLEVLGVFWCVVFAFGGLWLVMIGSITTFKFLI